jgi:hypothetical protein
MKNGGGENGARSGCIHLRDSFATITMKFDGGSPNLRCHGEKGGKGCAGLKKGSGKGAHKHHQGDSRRKQAGRTPTRQMVGSDILRRPGKVLSGAVLPTVFSGAKRSTVLSGAVLSGAPSVVLARC